MEENRLNEEELKQVAGGTGVNETPPGDPAHITQVTEYFSDKNLYYAIGTFREGTNVYMLSFHRGSSGLCWLVRSINSKEQVYVPDGTLQQGFDD